MTQIDKAKKFASLHIKGNPVILYNAWDAGSAKAIVEAGAEAIATSSWSVAVSQGYKDGEDLPLEVVQHVAERIAATVDVPVSTDFEGGYTDDDGELAANILKLLDLGIVGINFEDRVVKGSGLVPIERQAKRITAIRKAADQKGIPLVINARTDVFLGQTNDVDDAIERSKAYSAAGATSFFIPGLADDAVIGRIVEQSPLPVNVMMMGGVSPIPQLAKLGVARVSFGNISYVQAMAAIKKEAASFFG